MAEEFVVVLVDVEVVGRLVVVVLEGVADAGRVVVVGVVTVLDMVVGLLLVVLIAEVLAGFETLVDYLIGNSELGEDKKDYMLNGRK